MQTVPPGFLDSINGSVRPVVQVDAWYGGSLVASDLSVVGGSVTLDATRSVTGSANLSLASPDDSLVPKSYSAPLACYGSELHIRAGVATSSGTTMLSLGWLRIDDYECTEYYRPVPFANGTSKLVSSGTQVTVNCSDRMAGLADAQMWAPSQPASLSSCIAEIQRLCTGIVPVADLTAVTDAAVPATVTYSTSRVQAVQDLAAVLGMTAIIDQDGALTLLPVAFLNADGVMPVVVPSVSKTPVWTVGITEADAAKLLQWSRKGSRTGLYNAAISTGQTATGTPVSGSATLATGPLMFGGPFGQVPYGHVAFWSAPALNSTAACTQDAENVIGFLGNAQALLLPVQVPFNPALQLLDVVQLDLPSGTLTGPVQQITWPLTAAAMQVTVAVSRDDLWAV